MMMSLDLFLFEIGTLPYQQLAQEWNWRHSKSERFGARPAAQFVGVGDETVTLSGALYPGLIGDWSSFDTIRDMADAGEAYLLMGGDYTVHGSFFIRRVSRTADLFFVDGVARRADFTLELERAA